MRCLEKRPADRWQSAAELLHALESLGTPRDGRRRRPCHRVQRPKQAARRRPGRAAGARLSRLIVAVGWLAHVPAFARTAPLDADLVAVAPFDVPDARLVALARGAGGRALAEPRRRGPGPERAAHDGDPPLERPRGPALRRRAGPAHRRAPRGVREPDRRRPRFRAPHGHGARRADDRPLAEIELRDAADRMDRLADSLTVRLLRELGRTRRIEVFRTTAMGSTSLPALKAFLRGEQWFRRAAWDSALASYDQAIALDSTFPLALWRSGTGPGVAALGLRLGLGGAALRAGALNHGLAPRDSLLLTADSLSASAYRAMPRVDWPSSGGSMRSRRSSPVDTLTTSSRGTPWGRRAITWAVRSAALRARRSRPSTAPSRVTPRSPRPTSTLSSWRCGSRALKREPHMPGSTSPWPHRRIRGRHRTRRPAHGGDNRPTSGHPEAVGDASPSALEDAWPVLRRVPDSAETAIAVARAFAAAPPGDERWLTPKDRRRRLGTSLLYRGRVRDAAEILFADPRSIPPQLVEAALLSATPPDSAAPVFQGWLDDGAFSPQRMPCRGGRHKVTADRSGGSGE